MTNLHILIQQNEETTMKDGKHQSYLNNNESLLLNKLDKYFYNENNYKLFEFFKVKFIKRREYWKINKKIFKKILFDGLLNSNTIYKCEPDKKYPNQSVIIFHVMYLNKIYYIKIIFIKNDNLIKVLSAHKK